MRLLLLLTLSAIRMFAQTPCVSMPVMPGVTAAVQTATHCRISITLRRNAIVGNGGEESQCGWCKDRWGISWQITPSVLTGAMAAGGEKAKRAFAAMMEMGKIDIAAIEAARRG